MATFFSQYTGHPLSRKELSAAVELTNQESLLLKDVYKLRMQKLSPMDNRFLKDFGTVMSLLLGTE
jgi:hypothetical protein